MACYLQSGIQTLWNIWDRTCHKNIWQAALLSNFCKKIHLIFHLRGSEFDSDLKHSDKKYIYFTIDILCCKVIYKLMSLLLLSCFSFQIRKDLVLANFYYNAAVWRFLKTFRKFAGKRLWWRRFLGKFTLFKMDSGKGFFLLVFQTPFYGCFQTLNRDTFLWMITLFGANTPESSKICEKMEASSY